MSENLDLVRSIYADWERGDVSNPDWAAPEIEIVDADGPERGIWTGLAGLAESTRHFLTAWEDFRVKADEFREVDDERVLVLYHRFGRGRGSGLEIERMRAKGANLVYVRSGKVTRLVFYWNRDRALADLGLEE
jgi:ketosteroid isomerase-like protein